MVVEDHILLLVVAVAHFGNLLLGVLQPREKQKVGLLVVEVLGLDTLDNPTLLNSKSFFNVSC